MSHIHNKGVTEMSIDNTKKNRDLSFLAPFFESRFKMALNECHDHGLPIALDEGYRTPSRQDHLFEQGRTRPGKKVTNARAWQSFHQYGVAVDIAFVDGKRWFWPKFDDPLWERVHSIFERFGFEALDFERPHLQITAGMKWQEAKALWDKEGLQSVWDLIEKRSKA